MNSEYKKTLDNISYDTSTNSLTVNDKEVLTKEDAATDDIDFSGMF
jgi:hypothetical protein